MRSTFAGLNIGLSGAWAQQRALDVTGHNISNVNTPGYARQRVTQASSRPTYVGVAGNGNLMDIGTGVDVQEISQYRDIFLDQKLRRENYELGYWDARKSSIEELETIFNDNEEDGLQKVMDSFWNSWSQLSKPSGGLTARALVKENAIAFVETVKNMDEMLSNYKQNKNNEIKENIDRVNTIAQGIAELNYKIKKAEATGVKANDFRDQRDSLVTELTKMANIQVIEGASFNIALEGVLLVSDNESNPMVAVPDTSKDGLYSIKWKSTNADVKFRSGSIKAMIDTRDQLVGGYRDRLNEFVKGVAKEINNLHMAGHGNINPDVSRPMFVDEATNDATTEINLDNIAFNTNLNEVNYIAAAQGPPPGNYEDNRNALKISEWRLQDVFTDTKYDVANGKLNFDEFYRNIVTDIGLEGNKAANAADAQNLLVEQIENKRQSLMAVSLDEEMGDLIRYQHSYNAAVRVVNAIDEMIDNVVNKVGLGGR